MSHNKIQINRDKLNELYMNEIYSIEEDLPEKSSFSPKEIVNIICNILEDNSNLIKHE